MTLDVTADVRETACAAVVHLLDGRWKPVQDHVEENTGCMG